MNYATDTPEIHANKLPLTNPIGYALAAIIAPPIIAFGAIYAIITLCVEKYRERQQSPNPIRTSELEKTVAAHTYFEH